MEMFNNKLFVITISGKPPFSHGFPMVFLWFSYGFLLFLMAFPMGFPTGFRFRFADPVLRALGDAALVPDGDLES